MSKYIRVSCQRFTLGPSTGEAEQDPNIGFGAGDYHIRNGGEDLRWGSEVMQSQCMPCHPKCWGAQVQCDRHSGYRVLPASLAIIYIPLYYHWRHTDHKKHLYNYS